VTSTGAACHRAGETTVLQTATVQVCLVHGPAKTPISGLGGLCPSHICPTRQCYLVFLLQPLQLGRGCSGTLLRYYRSWLVWRPLRGHLGARHRTGQLVASAVRPNITGEGNQP
jgi:hypothetical protein